MDHLLYKPKTNNKPNTAAVVTCSAKFTGLLTKCYLAHISGPAAYGQNFKVEIYLPFIAIHCHSFGHNMENQSKSKVAQIVYSVGYVDSAQ